MKFDTPGQDAEDFKASIRRRMERFTVAGARQAFRVVRQDWRAKQAGE